MCETHADALREMMLRLVSRHETKHARRESVVLTTLSLIMDGGRRVHA